MFVAIILHHPLVALIPSSSHSTPCFLCPPLGRTGVGEPSGGHFLSQHTHGYANTLNIQCAVCVFCVGLCPCASVCPYPRGGRKAEILTLSSAWRGGGRWRFEALATPVFLCRLGSTWKAGFCRHAASGCQQGCDEVRPVAWGKKEGGGEEVETGIEKFSYRLGEWLMECGNG